MTLRRDLVGGLLSLLFSMALAAPTACAQNAGDKLPPAEAVDRPIDSLNLEGQSLAAVLEVLGEKAGVSFSVDEDTYAMLPWGRETKLATVQLEAVSLRSALEQILGPLGLTFEVGERSVAVTASGPLKRMNRRATWDDLKLLQWLSNTDFSAEGFAQVKVQYRITSKINAPELLRGQLERAGTGTIEQILTAATTALGWRWYPDKDHVVILSAQAHIAHNLARPITARYNQIGLAHILTDLATKADVPLFLDPGMMLKLPSSTAHNYTLLLQHTTVRQALELIGAETGLTYEIKPDGLFFTLSDEALGGNGAAKRKTDSYVARILVPAKNGGYAYELLIRESELPADIREYRRQMIDEMIEKMRQDMAPTAGTTP